MQGDITRSTFKREKHYDGVRMQQGRVQLDADWNEQLDIQAHRDHTTHADIIGPVGTPRYDQGCEVRLDNGEPLLSAGRIYVDGILCENEADVPLAQQADLPGVPLPTDDGLYLVYLDVWQRGVTALDDPEIREVALGGPDTATRTQVVSQARLLLVGDENATADCATNYEAWAALLAETRGRLAARAQPNPDAPNPCVVPAGAGFRRVENQLYRVEIHDGSETGAPTFKWSRENASVETDWRTQNVNDLTVGSLGRDEALGFATGQWVELIDDARELRREPGILVKLLKAEGQVLTIDPATATDIIDRANFSAKAKVRRWDMPAGSSGLQPVTIPAGNDGFIALEDGVEIRFEPGATYRSGDYWLIPARTISGDVEWPRSGNPPTAELREPHSPRHHLARLALLRRRDGAWEQPLDCRLLFPPLTRICADDICFDNTECQLVDVVTVQDALERLCGESDLRFHNKHLHGWGIVCGLQVHCGPDDGRDRRRNVTVLDGYAIDCDGNDIRVRADEILDVLRLIEELQARNPDIPILTEGRGDVSLVLGLDQNRRHTFTIEPYDPKKNTLQTMLAGTLLMDFYNDCIKRIQDFLKEQLTPPPNEQDLPAGPGTQRVAALSNLLAQVANPQTGQRLFLSRREHLILAEFYDKLRALLASETFCAMFDTARPFPAYPDQLGQMDTIFGKSQHDRLRLRPGGRDLYSVGAGLNPLRPTTLLNRYDLQRNLLAEQIDPLVGTQPDSGGKSDTGAGAVQDVAFSPDGRRIYVIVSTRNEENTFFRAGRIGGDGTITWGPVTTICGVKLVTLATTAADRNMVYAIGMRRTSVQSGNTTRVELRGAGLYKINPDNVDPNMTPFRAFNSVGHLVITPDGRAFATAAPDNTTPTTYQSVVGLQLPNGTPLFPTGQDRIAVAEGVDDIAVFDRSKGAERETLYVVSGRANSAKSLMAYGLDGQTLAGPIDIPDTVVRLEAYGPTRMLLMALEDDYSVRMLDMRSNQVVAGYLLPMQVGPLAITSDAQRQRVFVLNHLSNTITTADGALFRPEFRFPLSTLAAYRKAAVEAFVDLTAGFLQYLKDCLCDHFLTNCPECSGEEKLYLGVISIRDNAVYKVCNFSQRREVKSFPKLGYWLSLVPITPFIDRAIEEFCCRVLPDLFGRYVVPDFNQDQTFTAQPRVRTATLRAGVGQAQAFDLPARVGDIFRRGDTARDVIGARLSQPAERFAVSRPRIASTDLVGRPVAEAEEHLKDRGALVKRVAFDPLDQPGLAASVTDLFRQPTAGDEVTLYVENDQVRYFSIAGGAPETRELRTQVTSLSETVTSREAELQELRGRVEAQQALVAEVENLRTTLADTRTLLGERDTQLTTLRDQVRVLSEKQGDIESRVSDTRISELQTELRELRTFREEVTRFMRRPPNQ